MTLIVTFMYQVIYNLRYYIKFTNLYNHCQYKIYLFQKSCGHLTHKFVNNKIELIASYS